MTYGKPYDPKESARQLIGVEQATEGLARAQRLIDRYWPRRRTPHGFYQSGAFLDGLWENRHRPAFCEAVRAHCCQRVRNRDARMPQEAVLRHYRLSWLIDEIEKRKETA